MKHSVVEEKGQYQARLGVEVDRVVISHLA